MFQVMQRQKLGIRLQSDTWTDDLPENTFKTWKCFICEALLKMRENLVINKSPVYNWAKLSFAQKSSKKSWMSKLFFLNGFSYLNIIGWQKRSEK